ncbi:putative kinase-like protein TMKL1 [Prunus avium]|uniref:Kinase-like protein TMKL1 n=1 Tax=Prunus avium TaxID=42229 RepID=A0A6P5T8D7_PRUAV|nr:putative kinase-like protein TMKL1 [Prunus avium]
MKNTHLLNLILVLTSTGVLVSFVFLIYFYCKRSAKHEQQDVENSEQKHEDDVEVEDLMIFQDGQDLTICDILDAPGEVIGKSNYGTLYKALLQSSNSVRLLRFLRPVCTAKVEDFGEVVQMLGSIRHPNLVPLLGFYAGPRGEKLLIHPFYWRGNLAQFVRESNPDSHKWAIIYRISVGIAKGLDHLHTGLEKPIIHGNLKLKNVLLDRHYQPFISDFSLHLLLNPTAGQEMLELSASQGYKAPELIKMRDATEETDIYSLGVILLELLTGKEPINQNPTTPDEDFSLPDFMRNAVLGHRIHDLFHPDLLLNSNIDDEVPVTKEQILKFFQLAMTCCSPSPSLRPNTKQVLWKLEEIGN